MARTVITIDTVEDGPVLDAELVLKKIQDILWPISERFIHYPKALRTSTEQSVGQVLGIIEDYFAESIDPYVKVDIGSEPEPEPEPEPEEDRQKAEPDPPPATPAGWLGATAPEPNREPEIARELIAQLQLDHPSVDVDLVAAKVLAAYRSGQVKHTDRALRAWVAQAARKGTDQRPPERPQDFRARFERRLDREPHLGPEQRSTLWLKAQAAVRRGHGEELVLEAMMRSWVAELSETMRAPPPVGWASP